MKFVNQESRKLVKVAAAHRRIAQHAAKRLSREFRIAREFGHTVHPDFIRIHAKHIDANRRCSADDFAMAREVAK